MKKSEECSSFAEEKGENSFKKCDECSSFIEDNGKNICKKCGFVSNERIFEDKIPLTTKDNDENNNQIERVSRPLKSHTRKRLRNNNLIKKILSKSNCQISDDVKKEVIKIYNDLSSIKNRKGKNNFYGKKNLEYIVKGLYYYVCIKKQIGKTYTEIAMEFLSEEDKKNKKKIINEEHKIKKGFNDISREIENFGEEDNDYHTMRNYINTYLGNDKSKKEIKGHCQKIFSNIDEKGFLGDKQLKTKVGLSLLLSFKLSKQNIDKKTFYVKFSSKYILKNAFKEIKDNLKEIIPDELSDKLNLLQDNNLFD